MTFLPNISGFVSSDNSSASTLGIGATFTGTGEDVSKYSTVSVTIESDVDSAGGGVSMEFSSDNTNWDIISTVLTYNQSCLKFSQNFVVEARYFRIVYTNGGSAQTFFRLQTLYHISKPALNSVQQFAPISPLIDAFGRMRVSDPFNLIELTHVRDDNNQEETNVVTGTATIARDTDGSFELVSVLTSGDTAFEQSRRRGIYQPGKSLLILNTGVLNNDTNDTGVTTRIGYFDADDGIYFEHTGDGGSGTLSLTLRSSVSGSVVNTTVQQTDWNLDKMDGTGSSSINIDTSKTQIFLIDLEWLGVGRVRCGFVVGGAVLYCHQFLNANNNTVPYMNTASLPCRYEAASTVASAVGEMIHVCSAVISEGGFTPIGRLFTATQGNTLQTVGTIEEPVIAIRLKSTNPKINIRLDDIQSICTTGGNSVWRLYLFRDIVASSILGGGTSWVSAGTDSAVEYDVSSSTITTTGGVVINTGFISNNNDFITINLTNNNNSTLTSNISDLSDVMVFTMQTFTGNESYSASMTWSEII